MPRAARIYNRRVRTIMVDPLRVIPLHEIRRTHHFHELVQRMMRHGWQGRPIPIEVLADGKMRPSGHFMGWAATHRLAAARVVRLKKPGFRVPAVLVNGGRPSRRPMASRTTTDLHRYKVLKARRDPAAALLAAEIVINHYADKAGVL
jgi:hypothetical protein